NPAALAQAVAEYGKLDRATVMAPAMELAENGFQVTPIVAQVWETNREALGQSPSAARYYLKPDGGAYRAGETFRHPTLARTLRRFAASGVQGFYRGEIASTVVEHLRAGGGFLSTQDLADYRAPRASIVRSSYRGLDIASAGVRAWGNTMGEMLNIQDHFAVSPGEPRAGELLVQAMVIAQALDDRPQGLETLEPKKDGIPLERLSSPEFASERAALIRRRLKQGAVVAAPAAEPKPHDTTHISVMDAEGNAVALTTSIGPAFGARVLTPELGFLYAHSYRMRSHPAPGARDDTEMTPTICFRDGRPVLVIGAAGAQRIPPAIYQVIANLVDREYTLARAVAAPRIYAVKGKIWLESGFPESVIKTLRDSGYEVAFDPKTFHLGRVHAVQFDPDSGLFAGAADPRYDGVVAGIE
ncbi:MAG: hypothetical protein GY953_06700, partial [bacterium]|nr:hypothetical protein [bacterium]